MSRPDKAHDASAEFRGRGRASTVAPAPERMPQRRPSTMTVISPLRSVVAPRRWPGGWLCVRVLFAYTNASDRARRRSARKAPRPGRTIGARVRAMGFIHSSHFALIPHFPPQGQRADDVRKSLLLFVSNYDGGFAEYIDGFSEVIPRGMKLFWGTSYGFPGPLPVTPFKAYIAANEFRADHEYFAHPGATTRTIVSAVEFRDLHAAFHKRAATLTPERFEDEYRKLVAGAQEHL
jgi:hypothetical protein